MAGAGLLGALLGCGGGSSAGNSNAVDVTGNWQLQTFPAATTSLSAPSGVLFLGALASSGGKVSGTVRFYDLGQPQACGVFQAVAVAGQVDSARNLTLTTGTLPGGGIATLKLLLPATLSNTAVGTVAISGGASACQLPATAGTGVQIANVSGTYTGTLTPGTLLAPGTSGGGPATIALTQASTPAADGQFPVTATVQATIGTCTLGATSLAGNASGVGVLLSSGQSSTSVVDALAVVPPAGGSLLVSLAGTAPSCPKLQVTGTLTRQ